MIYKIKTHELCWYNCSYTIEADSKEEAVDLIESGDGDLEYNIYDTTEQINIKSVEEI